MIKINKYNEFVVTKGTIEELINSGAEYIPAEEPQSAQFLLPWKRINKDCRSKFNLNNVPDITSGDVFVLDGVEYYPVKEDFTKLKVIREAKLLSQGQLAAASGVSVRMIQYYEQRSNDINKAQGITLFKLAQALDCKIEDLLEI